jgi:hypothetical protein
MGWLIVTLIGIATIFFMIVSPGFRILVLVLIGGLVLWFFNSIDESHKQSIRDNQARARSDYVAKNTIKAPDLSLQKVSLNNRKFAPYWTLERTVANNSEHPLSSLRFTITMKDCPPTKGCSIIGQESVDATTNVPAGQVRAFSSRILEFNNMPAATNPRWEYELIEIRSSL